MCMPDVRLVVLGQTAEIFESAGFGDIRKWQEVIAEARRRRSYYNGGGTLACFIASRSDIDDIIPLLTAYQIEWNKLHYQLRRSGDLQLLKELSIRPQAYARLANHLGIAEEDFDRLYAIWDRELGANFEKIARSPCDLQVRLLSGSMSEYRRARNSWWDNIESVRPDIGERPVYFVSSNTHSLANILSGFALKKQDDLVSTLERPGNSGLKNEWTDLLSGRSPSSKENFLYYLLKKAQQQEKGTSLLDEQLNYERSKGILAHIQQTFF